jgi:succinate dehydrogenase/fumarate reductase-like Fe-S protein
MKQKMITVRLFRHNPSIDEGPVYKAYTIPFTEGMSALNALDYIYQNLDPTIAYYDHAGCALGICARCTGRINGKAGLLCQTYLPGDAEVTIEPTSPQRVLRDLVMRKQGTSEG